MAALQGVEKAVTRLLEYGGRNSQHQQRAIRRAELERTGSKVGPRGRQKVHSRVLEKEKNKKRRLEVLGASKHPVII